MNNQGELPRETIEDEDTEGKNTNSEEDRAKQKTNDEEGDGPSKKKRMFSLPELKGNRQEWELPDELKELYDERFQNHLSEKEIEEFKETAIPKN